jgi:signal transduction histidine kinase
LPAEPQIEPQDQSWIVVVPQGSRSGVQISKDLPFFKGLPQDLEWTVISRIAGVWGNRFNFESMFGQEWFPFASSDVEAESIAEPLEEEALPRSEQVITLPIGEADSPLGYVELSSGPDVGAEALATTRRAFLLAAGGAMILAVVVGLLVSQGLSAPLRSLAAAAGCMSGDLSTRAPVRGRDEIGQLAQQLNQMAERLEASFAALNADRDALRRFIADASHELRTPITALKNFVELLQGAAADDPPARQEFLAESASQIDRLEWITRNLLDLSRLDAGLTELDFGDHEAGELAESASAAFKTLAQEKEITVTVNVPAAPVFVCCDRGRVELALSNLVSNALKFTPRGGRVEVGAAEAGDSVRFWVLDDGPGIPLADQPRVFERFYRGQGSRAEGSGLGLAIVHSVAQAHDGRVWVESEPGVGSRFVFELPAGNRS